MVGGFVTPANLDKDDLYHMVIKLFVVMQEA